jgi:uncharacterized cupredoxin-like copper-binding protein
MRTRTILGAIAGITILSLLTACGGSDDDKDTAVQSQATQAPAGSTGDAGAATAAPQALEVKAGDYFYEPKDLTVKAGTVKITMANAGPDRPHTMNVKNKSGSGDLVKSERIQVGQSGSIEFTVMEAGTYEVYCSLPGHADRGQKGTLTVTS